MDIWEDIVQVYLGTIQIIDRSRHFYKPLFSNTGICVSWTEKIKYLSIFRKCLKACVDIEGWTINSLLLIIKDWNCCLFSFSCYFIYHNSDVSLFLSYKGLKVSGMCYLEKNLFKLCNVDPDLLYYSVSWSPILKALPTTKYLFQIIIFKDIHWLSNKQRVNE